QGIDDLHTLLEGIGFFLALFVLGLDAGQALAFVIGLLEFCGETSLLCARLVVEAAAHEEADHHPRHQEHAAIKTLAPTSPPPPPPALPAAAAPPRRLPFFGLGTPKRLIRIIALQNSLGPIPPQPRVVPRSGQ